MSFKTEVYHSNTLFPLRSMLLRRVLQCPGLILQYNWLLEWDEIESFDTAVQNEANVPAPEGRCVWSTSEITIDNGNPEF
jgi:hypothetical protein